MNRKKKVLMLASVASMIDQFNMSNIRLLLEMGYEVHVACNFREGNTCSCQRIKKFQKMLQSMHVVWHQWDCPRNIFPVTKCCIAYWQLWKLTGQYDYDWMHCHSPIGGALARLAAHWRKIRVIYTAHGFHFYLGAPFKNWLLYYPAEKLMSYWTDVLVTVNEEDYRLAGEKFKAGKVCYIPGVGIDTDRYEQKSMQNLARGIFQIPDHAYILLSVGELNKGKNHRMVMKILARLDRKDVYYLICGQGKRKKELQKYAKRIGISELVRIPGYQENMPLIYHCADIFVFPSVREGMPVALMEAMAAGLPCIVSDIRGNKELIGGSGSVEESGGVRFTLNKPGQLQDALEEMLSDKELRRSCGERNRKKMKGYSCSVVQKKMKEIYTGMEVKNE